MAKGFKVDRKKNESRPKGMAGVNVLTTSDFGVYVDGADKVIDMYERGEISREDLYSTILDLDVVYKSRDAVESKGEESLG